MIILRVLWISFTDFNPLADGLSTVKNWVSKVQASYVCLDGFLSLEISSNVWIVIWAYASVNWLAVGFIGSFIAIVIFALDEAR